MSVYENGPLGGELSHPSIPFDEWVEAASHEGGEMALPDVRNHPLDTSTDRGIEMRFPYGQTIEGDEVIDPRDIRGGAEPAQTLHDHLVVRGTVQLNLALNPLTNQPEPVATFSTTHQLPAGKASSDVFIWSTEQIMQVPLYSRTADPESNHKLLRAIQQQGLKRLVADMKVIPGYAVGQADEVYGEITHVYASEKTYRMDDPMPRYGESVVVEGTVTDQQLQAPDDQAAMIQLDVAGRQLTIDSPRTYARLDKQINLDNPQAGIDPPTIRTGDTIQVNVYATEDGEGFSTQPQKATHYDYSPDITSGKVPAYYLVRGGAERADASVEEAARFNSHLTRLAEAENAQQFRQAAGRLLADHLNPDQATQVQHPFLLSAQQLEAIYDVVHARAQAIPTGPDAPLISIASPTHEIPGTIHDYLRVQSAFEDLLRDGFEGTVFSISRAELVALSEEYVEGYAHPSFSEKEAGSNLLALLKAAQPTMYDRVLRDSLTPQSLDTLCDQSEASAEALAATLHIVLTKGKEWATNDPARTEQLLQAYSHLLDSPHKDIVDPQLEDILWGLRGLVSQSAEFSQSLLRDTTVPAENTIVALRNPALAVVATHATPLLDKLDTWIRETPRDADDMVNDPRFSTIRQFIKTSARYHEEVASLRIYLQHLANYEPQGKWRTS